MSGGRAIWLTARREIRERLRSRAFRVSTLIQVLAVAAVAVIASVTGGGGETKVEVGTIGSRGEATVTVAKAMAAPLDLRFETTSFDSPEAAIEAIKNGEIEAAAGSGRVIVSEDTPEQAQAVLAEAASNGALKAGLIKAGLDAGEVGDLLGSSRADLQVVPGEGDDAGSGIAFITTLLLYLALIFCGYAVAGGVVEEKATRVVELLINAIRPRELLAGKVLGIGVMGLAQLLLIVAVGLGTALAMGEIDLPPATADTALLALVFFVLGFGFYGCAFAVAGSVVSRQEDSSTTTAPVMFLLVAAYILSVSATNDPGSDLAVATSLFPPTAPLIVPARAAAGNLPPEQLMASILLMVLGCALLIWFAGRLYERTVLRMGAPLKIGEAIRLFRSS